MRPSPFLATFLLAAGTGSQAQMSPAMKMPKTPPTAASAAAESNALTDADVQQVDAAAGLVTLKHGDIANMQMPAMTMAFGVADKKMLKGIKAGDKVRFRLEKVDGAPTVVHLEPVH